MTQDELHALSAVLADNLRAADRVRANLDALRGAYDAVIARALKAEAERDEAEAEADQLRAAYDDVRALNAEIAVGATNQALAALEHAAKVEAALSEVANRCDTLGYTGMAAFARAALAGERTMNEIEICWSRERRVNDD